MSWILVPALAVLGFVLFIFLTQRSQIYFPQRYASGFDASLPTTLRKIPFETSSGPQLAFYLPPEEAPDVLPSRLWIFFGGNAMQAMDWAEWVASVRDDRAGYLLVDYPGYGASAGRPTRESIIDSALGAFNAIAKHLNTDSETLARRTALLGQSLGAAVALEIAARHPVERIVLLSPFTRLMDMARLQVGWPLCHLLLDRFDNAARLAEIHSRNPQPRIYLFHGDADSIIPVRMSRELKETYPDWIQYTEIPGADHNDLLYIAEEPIRKVMTAE